MTLPRVFFDANDGSMEDGYRLGFDQSRKDLAALGTTPAQGTAVIIYMPNELEMMATLRFDVDEDVWRADPIRGTITQLDGGRDDEEFWAENDAFGERFGTRRVQVPWWGCLFIATAISLVGCFLVFD